MLQDQLRRGPGRPRKSARRVHVDITLSLEVLQYIDTVTINRSGFIEECILAHKRMEEGAAAISIE